MVLGYSMATNGTPAPPDFDNSDLMNYVVRMVIPMRREFSRSLDVSHFLHDFAYAKEIIDQAKLSKDARLREYALYLEGKLAGPRNATVPSESDAKKAASKPSEKPVSSGAAMEDRDIDPMEAQMRERMLSKYKSGLR
jgi:hypothetical protein